MKLSRAFISATRQISTLESRVPAPYFRKTITITEDIAKADLSRKNRRNRQRYC